MIEINGTRLYDTEELAQLFRVSTVTVSNMRRRGELHYVTLGRRKYSSEEAIREYLNGYPYEKGNKVIK